MRHRKKELLFYIKVECMCDEKFLVPFQKQQKKERDKLIRDTLKRNTGKLIEGRRSITLAFFFVSIFGIRPLTFLSYIHLTLI